MIAHMFLSEIGLNVGADWRIINRKSKRFTWFSGGSAYTTNAGLLQPFLEKASAFLPGFVKFGQGNTRKHTGVREGVLLGRRKHFLW